MRCTSLERALVMMMGVARHAARALADLQAVHARQHQVQHQRVPAAPFQPAHAFMTVGGMLDRVAFVAQHAQQFGDVGVVLDDQHAAGGFHGARAMDSAIVANRRGRVITFFKFA